jgi:hypothetical protein
VVVINTLSFRGQNMFCCCCCGAAQLLGVTTAHGNRGGPNDDVYGPRKHNTNMESAVTFARHRNHHAAAFIFWLRRFEGMLTRLEVNFEPF